MKIINTNWMQTTTSVTTVIVVVLSVTTITAITTSACHTSVDCSMNGECVRTDNDDGNDPQSDGLCKCFHGWKGTYCDMLNLQPLDTNFVGPYGLKLEGNVSTWGGSIIYYDKDNTYHMYASRMVNQCGLSTWTTNSEVIHAVSKNGTNPLGPYEFHDVVLPVFAHEPNAMIAPTTGEIVIYVTALPGVKPRNCNETSNGDDGVTNGKQEAEDDEDDDEDKQQLPPPKEEPTPERPSKELHEDRSPVVKLNSSTGLPKTSVLH